MGGFGEYIHFEAFQENRYGVAIITQRPIPVNVWSKWRLGDARLCIPRKTIDRPNIRIRIVGGNGRTFYCTMLDTPRVVSYLNVRRIVHTFPGQHVIFKPNGWDWIEDDPKYVHDVKTDLTPSKATPRSIILDYHHYKFFYGSIVADRLLCVARIVSTRLCHRCSDTTVQKIYRNRRINQRRAFVEDGQTFRQVLRPARHLQPGYKEFLHVHERDLRECRNWGLFSGIRRNDHQFLREYGRKMKGLEKKALFDSQGCCFPILPRPPLCVTKPVLREPPRPPTPPPPDHPEFVVHRVATRTGGRIERVPWEVAMHYRGPRPELIFEETPRRRNLEPLPDLPILRDLVGLHQLDKRHSNEGFHEYLSAPS